MFLRPTHREDTPGTVTRPSDVRGGGGGWGESLAAEAPEGEVQPFTAALPPSPVLQATPPGPARTNNHCPLHSKELRAKGNELFQTPLHLCINFFFLNCGKKHNIKFTTFTIFKCTVKDIHSV